MKIHASNHDESESKTEKVEQTATKQAKTATKKTVQATNNLMDKLPPSLGQPDNDTLFKYNKYVAISDIVMAVIMVAAWFLATGFIKPILLISCVAHAYLIYQNKHHDLKITGAVLGVVASGLSLVTVLFALPSIVLYIIATVFLFKHKPIDTNK